MKEMQMFEVKDHGIWRKLKALLTSRTDTLKQSDAVTDALMTKLQEAGATEERLRKLLGIFSGLVVQQHMALMQAERHLRDDDEHTEERDIVHRAVVEALKAAAAHV